MILFKRKEDLIKWLEGQRENNRTIGFVPTMGALHPGHISLIQSAKKENAIVVCSIFVNPTQFNDTSDYEKYPITIEDDILLLEQNGCNVLFLPSISEIYPDGTSKRTHYDLGHLESILEGKFRPGHFQGVCTVVDRLLRIINPENLYLGQKDYQQCMVINKLVELTGMSENIKIHVCPTLREDDGLAMSSRNRRLDATQRSVAPTIYNCLTYIKEKIEPGNIEHLIKETNTKLLKKGFKPDYIEVVDAITLKPVRKWDAEQKIVGLIAAFLGEIRLIDNMPLN
ncbi:MAG TPA: pantoate--beta-alanine ligase [Chitinophagaceae bacterium]|nr:pantoate--beta-alanine ligase [Chitinophagaceae bacterium]